MIAIPEQPTGVAPCSSLPQLRSASQAKLAFKRYTDARAIGDDEEAANAFANWQRLASITPATREGHRR